MITGTPARTFVATASQEAPPGCPGRAPGCALLPIRRNNQPRPCSLEQGEHDAGAYSAAGPAGHRSKHAISQTPIGLHEQTVVQRIRPAIVPEEPGASPHFVEAANDSRSPSTIASAAATFYSIDHRRHFQSCSRQVKSLLARKHAVLAPVCCRLSTNAIMKSSRR